MLPEEPATESIADAIAFFDTCLLAGAAPISADDPNSRYEEFLRLDLSNIPSSLRPRDIASFAELEAQGATRVLRDHHLEFHEDDLGSRGRVLRSAARRVRRPLRRSDHR